MRAKERGVECPPLPVKLRERWWISGAREAGSPLTQSARNPFIFSPGHSPASTCSVVRYSTHHPHFPHFIAVRAPGSENYGEIYSLRLEKQFFSGNAEILPRAFVLEIARVFHNKCCEKSLFVPVFLSNISRTQRPPGKNELLGEICLN